MMKSFIFQQRSKSFYSFKSFMNSYSEFESFINGNSIYMDSLERSKISVKHLYYLLIHFIQILTEIKSKKIFLSFVDKNLVLSINQDYPSEVRRHQVLEIDFISLIGGLPFHSNFFYFICLDSQYNYTSSIPDWFYAMYSDPEDDMYWSKYLVLTEKHQNYRKFYKMVVNEINYL